MGKGLAKLFNFDKSLIMMAKMTSKQVQKE